MDISFSEYFDNVHEEVYMRLDIELGREPTDDEVFFEVEKEYQSFYSGIADEYEAKMRGE